MRDFLHEVPGSVPEIKRQGILWRNVLYVVAIVAFVVAWAVIR